MASTRTPCVVPASASTRRCLLPLLLCTLALPLHAQTDTSVFRFLPKYYPDEEHDASYRPGPDLIFRPEVIPPRDPALRNVKAVVWVMILVDRSGGIRETKILLSRDQRFNAAALAYARRLRFRWREELRPDTPVWVSIPVRFGE